MLVLFVDDEAETAYVVRELLTDEGYQVLTAMNGQEAIEVLAGRAPPALILLDLMMPVMNGWEFRRWQRQQAGLADVPVVLLSAADTIDVSAKVLDVAGYLRKPFNCDQLVGTVASFAHRLQPYQPSNEAPARA